MKAVALDSFGGLEALKVQTLPQPQIGKDEILIRVQAAGVGVWDPFEREGGFAREFGIKAKFPYVMGTEGAGTVTAIGKNVRRFKIGDRAAGIALMSPKGGFYAEYTAVKEDAAILVPDNLTIEQAAVVMEDAVTALRGLEDTLNLREQETLLIFGASGGIGHLAVQIAKRMGARVFAVASEEDGVLMVKKLNVDRVVEGHSDDIVAKAKEFAPDGFSAALLTAGGEAAQKLLTTLKKGGRAAYPNGVEPEPKALANIKLTAYDGTPDRQVIEKIERYISSPGFHVHVAKTFRLDEVVEAHKALETHYLGKLALRIAE